MHKKQGRKTHEFLLESAELEVRSCRLVHPPDRKLEPVDGHAREIGQKGLCRHTHQPCIPPALNVSSGLTLVSLDMSRRSRSDLKLARSSMMLIRSSVKRMCLEAGTEPRLGEGLRAGEARWVAADS